MVRAPYHEIGGEVQRKKQPCAVQRSRASRNRTDAQILADYERYCKYAGWLLILLFAAIFVTEVVM